MLEMICNLIGAVGSIMVIGAMMVLMWDGRNSVALGLLAAGAGLMLVSQL